MKKSLFLFILLFSFFSCSFEIGMGREVDLEAPVLTIDTPASLSRVHRNVTLAGTCTDNTAVTYVSIENKDTKESYGEANISGNNWSKDVYLPEGEITLLVTAHDEAGNYSVKSYKSITLLVDETAPEGLSWYIEKTITKIENGLEVTKGNNIQEPLRSRAFLENLSKEDLVTHIIPIDDATNKNIPQNEEFTIHGHMYDAMNINTITLILTDEDGIEHKNEVKAQSLPTNKSIYTPSFTFTHEKLVSENPKLDTGKHYLKVSYYSSDETGNSATHDLEYLLWYPESDYPNVWQAAVKNNELQIDHGSAIPVHFYDDDAIVEARYGFILIDETEGSLYKQVGNTEDKIIENKNKLTDYVYIKNNIDSPISDIPTSVGSNLTANVGTYVLVCYVRDIRGKEKTRYIRTIVADPSKPLIIIEKPTENTVPKIENDSEFIISGYSYDSSGSKEIKIAFIPDTVATTQSDRERRAKELFEDSSILNTTAGEIIKSKIFDTNKLAYKDGNWIKEPFSFTFNVLSDFKKSSQANKAKNFVLRLEDTDKNIEIKHLRVNGDTDKPEIIIATPINNMDVCDYRNRDLVFEFRAEKNSGLGFDESKYRIERQGSPFVWKYNDFTKVTKEDNKEYLQLVIPKDTVKKWAEEGTNINGIEVKADTQPVFTFYAADLLGNENSVQRAVVLSPLPVLEKITTTNANGLYKAGEKIVIQAKFTDTVKVTGSPKLKLKYKSSDSNYVTAEYKTGTGTDTLTFEWLVPPNAESEKLLCDGFVSGAMIETGTAGKGNAYFETIPANGNLQDSSSLRIDGKKPILKNVVVSTSPLVNPIKGKTYVKKDIDIICTLEFSEPIFVSESPSLNLSVESKVNNFSFQSINGNNVIFSHRVTTATNEGELQYLYSNLVKCISDEDIKRITDEAGNPIELNAKDEMLNLIIDKTPPNKAPKINIAAGIYNQQQTLELSEIEEFATAEYSLNSGVTWQEYNVNSKPIIGAGNYTILTRQKDLAGNISPKSSEVDIIINNTFPKVESILISGAAGDYKVGDKLGFKVFLSENVKPFDGNAITLAFTNKSESLQSDNKTTLSGRDVIEVNAKAETQNVNTICFEYTVKKNDYLKGVQVISVNFGNVKDKYDNKQDSETKSQIANLINNEDCNRSDITIDGIVPIISSKVPQNNGVGTYISEDDEIKGYKKGDFVITLNFSEEIAKESGNIILQRNTNWAIPAVLSKEEFFEYYNKASLSSKEKLMLTSAGNGSGSERLDARTGIAVGPYKKITHGLKAENGKYIPDTETKYVLDFDLGLETGSKTFDPNSTEPKVITVADIRSALEEVGYHKHVVDVNSSNVLIDSTKKKVEIRFPATYSPAGELIKDGVANGIEWKLIIEKGVFRDNTGNIFDGLSTEETETYILNSDKVATPVVRVDRYSHGWGAKEPDSSGTLTEITGWNYPAEPSFLAEKGPVNPENAKTGTDTKPSGYVRVRVDTQTIGATIYKKEISGGSKDINSKACSTQYKYNGNTDSNPTVEKSNADVIFSKNNTNLSYTITNNEDATLESLSSFEPKEENKISENHIFVLGDGSELSASKDYVLALAKKQDFSPSLIGREGVFKTTIYSKRLDDKQINIEGGTAKGGEPNVSGFPLRDATSDPRYSKNAYLITEGGDANKAFVWQTYEIVTDFAYLQHRSNYATNYPKGSYGQLMYLYNFSTWE